MTDWVVRITVRTPKPFFTEELAADLAERLHPHSGTVSWFPDAITGSFVVEVATPARAVSIGAAAMRRALAWQKDMRIVLAEAKMFDELERELSLPVAPELVGLSEAAEILAVSKQRVAELAREGRLPAPVAGLAGGNVWTRASIEAFLRHWDRRPGRPKRATGQFSSGASRSRR